MDLGSNLISWVAPDAFELQDAVELADNFVSNLFLLVVVGENDWGVLSSPIISLLIEGGWIVECEEKFNHVFIVYFCWVVLNM